MVTLRAIAVTAATWTVVKAHTVITYPGWRGNNLHTNGTAPELNPGSLGIDYDDDGSPTFPYGMQWMYPCGGMPITQNRTLWPVKGGAVSVQPGWFPGHANALVYLNIGINEPGNDAPANMSHNVIKDIAITGPSNEMYGGQFCFPQVPMPRGADLKVGDNITIQVIETAQHGAALYSCVDVTLAEPEDVEEVTPENCYNSSHIGIQSHFYTSSLESAAPGLLLRSGDSNLGVLLLTLLVSAAAALM